MQKNKRFLAIEKLITEETIPSQEALLRKLKSKGMNCTQATLSRNLRQIGAARIPDGKGGYKYSLPEGIKSTVSANGKMQILPVIREIVDAKGLIVIKTLPGNANNTAIFIDNSSRYELAGTIAGDDTVLIIPRNGISNHQVHICLELIFPGIHEQTRKK